MKCTICKNNYPDIHKIHHGEKIFFMCSKSWNDWLADFCDDTIPEETYIFPQSCPNKDARHD